MSIARGLLRVRAALSIGLRPRSSLFLHLESFLDPLEDGWRQGVFLLDVGRLRVDRLLVLAKGLHFCLDAFPHLAQVTLRRDDVDDANRWP